MSDYEFEENTSGRGKESVIPEEIKGWSWGGFLLNWVWAIFNSTWIGLLALVPYVGFVMYIVLGLKGREWAWRNKQWQSVNHFLDVQRKWTIAAFIVLLLGIAAGIIFTVLLIIGNVSFVTR